MPEFDIPAAIRKLAEAELACPKAGGDRDLGLDVSVWGGVCVAGRVCIGVDEYGYGRYAPCPECKGTGRFVPFAALRVGCNARIFPLSVVLVTADYDKEIAAEAEHQEQYHREKCPCRGQRWIPERDLEKACWRIHTTHPYICYATTVEEEIRAALAWLEEQHEH